jgi:uncharacterized protein
MPARPPAVVAVLLALLGPARADADAAPGGGPPGRLIRVSGEGRVTVRPDVAVVHAGVQASGQDLSRIRSETSTRMRRVLAALAQAGIPERDVRTTRHDIQLERAHPDGRPGEITGYRVTEEVRVVVRDLARLGAVLERALAAGANTLRDLSFEKDDETDERREALARAVADARGKAEAIAAASGVALGDLLELAESGAAPPIPFVQRGLAAHAEGAPVSPGELEIVARIDAAWAIR